MAFKPHYKSYAEIKDNIAYKGAVEISSLSIRTACLNNDLLLKQCGITFAKQLRQLASNGIILKRRYYEQLRQGVEAGPKLMWISYLVWYWHFFHGHTFTVAELQSPGLLEKIKASQTEMVA